MLQSKIFSIFLLFCFQPLFVGAIYGGKNVEDPNKYPWIVRIGGCNDGKESGTKIFHILLNDGECYDFCGGSIISENVVMTAGHCIYEHLNSKMQIRDGLRLKVYAGHSDLNSNRLKKYLVKSVIMNPLYKSSLNTPNDIALLVLSKNLQFSNEIQKIELPPAEMAHSC